MGADPKASASDAPINTLAARSGEELSGATASSKPSSKRKLPAWPKLATRCLAASCRTGVFWPSGTVSPRPSVLMFGCHVSVGLNYTCGVKVREVIKVLEDDGWRMVRTKGSHRQFHHPARPGTVTVSGKPGVDVLPGTRNSILKQAGLK